MHDLHALHESCMKNFLDSKESQFAATQSTEISFLASSVAEFFYLSFSIRAA